MAHFDKAFPFSNKWMDQRIGINTLTRVLNTEY